MLIGYVDNHGTSTERIVDPLGLEGGMLTALDHRSEEIRTFAVHRITTVTPVAAGRGLRLGSRMRYLLSVPPFTDPSVVVDLARAAEDVRVGRLLPLGPPALGRRAGDPRPVGAARRDRGP